MLDKTQMTAWEFNRLFSSYPQFQVSDDAMRAYSDAVAPFEAIDLREAVTSFLTGYAPGMTNASYAPSAPMVGAEVRRQMNLRLDREAREKLAHPTLPPPDVTRTPEAQARVKALMEKTVANLKSISPPEDEATKAHRREMILKASDNAENEAYRQSDKYRRILAGDMEDRDD